MDFTIRELRQLIKYCVADRNKTKVGAEHFAFVNSLLRKISIKFKNTEIQDINISLPHMKATLAEKTLLLISKGGKCNREARMLRYDIELLTNAINAIK